MITYIKRLLFIIVLCIFVYSGYQLSLYLYDGYVSSKLNNKMKQQYLEIQQMQQEMDHTDEAEWTDEQLLQMYQDRFKQLQEMNNDIVGWVSIENTGIDYPVAQTNNNDYYLNHNIEQQSSARGAIFMDYRNANVSSNQHTVIYGHHMKDGSMFGELSKYKEAAYYQDHDTITYESAEGISKWKVFSVYIYSPEDQFFEYEFADQEQYSDYLEKIKKKSRYDTGLEVNADDQLLTLVTCTYEISDARFIIHAKRVE